MADTPDLASLAPDDVRGYMRTRRQQFGVKKKITEEMGQTRSDFVDEVGLNKTALGFCERLDRMTPEVRGDVLRSIDAIRDTMDGVWTQEATGEMFPDEPAQEKAKRARKVAAAAESGAGAANRRTKKKAKANGHAEDNVVSFNEAAAPIGETHPDDDFPFAG